ncbi:serine/threonine-protein phosphatase [Streptomyces pluripotens]|uniref:Serine/threonine-protein phosphatase n=1 Tax=Streptomyces pluripotens TaxID=1355015 RepID=A0A221NUK8_9ACTN|nr:MULTISPECIES: PP2C family protein-serine/threonine phosphatase [Streptomyces]ARP69372.1 protein phosphatase [Streptomyces pluripotens]ASN23630.1 serine/threonine-protein phosphatase [Streptomyces pluripotens]KIE28338.1 protein phosphatase [Streptomyces sp. MUSC 125]MCH0555320.1 serine/threonine-protein phosphatase [Streptomyces sp. MUM 16J]
MIRIKARAPTVRGAVLPFAWGAAAVAYKYGCPLARQGGLGGRIVTSAVFFAVGAALVFHVRRALLRELRQVRRVARAAQSVVLRPLPPRLEGLNVAAAQLSADRGACVGGDLYEAIATEYGVRVVMGDVRGHGLAALGTVAALLGSFREAAHDEPELDRVLRRMDRALARHLREQARTEHPSHGGPDPGHPVVEDFVTVLLLEIGENGELRVLNCGHPWPYLLSGSTVEPLTRTDPLPPLGPFALPAKLEAHARGHLLVGESLVLFTDGAEDARDARGRFFSLPGALADVVRNHTVTPQAVLRTVFTALLGHTDGRPTDDVALLVLRNERGMKPGAWDSDLSGPGARLRPAMTRPQPTTRR